MIQPRERRSLPLSDEQIEQLADKLAEEVAERAYQKFTAFVGRSVIKNIMIFVVLAAVGIVAAWKLYTGRP